MSTEVAIIITLSQSWIIVTCFLWFFICCKTKLEKFVSKKYVFYKINIICRKNVFIWKKKKFYIDFFFYWKKRFYREKYKWKCKNVYISFEKYIFMQKMFVLQIKYKSFLNIYSFCKKLFLILKNIFAKTSLWTQQSGP